MQAVATDPRNAEALFPYLNGEDLNSRPDASASRWVIDFNDRTGAQAAEYRLPFARVVERIQPERAANNRSRPGRLRSSSSRRTTTWWQAAALQSPMKGCARSLKPSADNRHAGRYLRRGPQHQPSPSLHDRW